MKYISTRGDATGRRFSEILLEGLAPDGGLYLPTHYPQVDDATLSKWRALPYAELAFEILSLYIDDIPPADLKALAAKTYTPEVFGTREIVGDRLDDVLAIVEHALDAQVVDVGILQAEHLRLLERAHAAERRQHEHVEIGRAHV